MSEPDEQRQTTPAEPRSLPSWAAFASMGLTLATCVAAGVLLGIWADETLHTSPLLLFVGLITGCAVATVAVVTLIRRNL